MFAIGNFLDKLVGNGRTATVVEVESPVLGAALLARPSPMFVRTSVLVTNLAVHFKRGRDNPMAAITRTRRLVWSSRAELYESFRQRAPYDTWTDEALCAYVDEGTFERPDGEYELYCPGRIEAQIYHNADSIDGFACLAALRIPALIVRGEGTDSFDEARASRALSCLRAGRLLTVPGATNYVPMGDPRLIADLILAERTAWGYTEPP